MYLAVRSEMDFRILGPLEVYDAGRALPLGGLKMRSLLAVLLLNAGEVVSSDRLIDELWGERPPEGARKALHVHVSNLRRALEAGDGRRYLATRSPGYLLEVEPGQLDLERFERLRASGRELRLADDPHGASERLRKALALWRGQPLADLALEPFAQRAIARLEELRVSVAEERIEADLELGRQTELIAELEALVAEHPLRERLHAQLMLALYRSGRQAEALEAYGHVRRTLVEELGLEPGRELKELQRAMLAQDPELDRSAPATRVQSDRATTGLTFVGREGELAHLLGALEEAFVGHGRLVLVGGEPGIGKSRLLEELGRHAKRRGSRVLSGRCWEAGGAPVYWPWVQSLRSYIRGRPPETVREELGMGAADLAQILPDVRELLPDGGPPASPESDGARFRLFDSTASFLSNAAKGRPLVLLIDDLHAADAPSLLLLEFLGREVPAMRVLIVAAYRDAEVSAEHPLAATLAELARETETDRLKLGGLSEQELARFIELTTGTTPPANLVAAIHSQTDGSPLFVGELVRLLAEDGHLRDPSGEAISRLPIPQTVRAVIGRRLHQLPADCRGDLSLASVLGREFRLAALERLSGRSSGALLNSLDDALDARVVVEPPGTHGFLRFSHALVRDTLYEGIGTGERVRLHQMAGEALEVLYAHDLDPHLAELAHHFHEAAPGGASDLAISYAWRAGDRAARLLAYEEAVRLYRMAIEALSARGQVDEEARCELLLALGEALTRAGDPTAAKEAFLSASKAARKLHLPEQFGRAALGFEGRFVWPRATDQRTIPLLEEALGLLEGDSALRVGVLARLCGALRAEPWRQDREALSKEAVASGRRLGDSATLAYALEGRWAVVFDAAPELPKERLAIATEMAELGHTAGNKERAWSGHLARLVVLTELGDRRAADAELGRITDLAEALRQPAQLQMTAGARATFALLDGRFEQAEDLIGQAVTLGRRAWIGSLLDSRLQLWMLRRHQARLPEVREAIERCVVEFPERGPLCRSVLAHLYAALGEAAEARKLFEELAAGDFADVPPTSDRLVNLGLLSEVAAMLADADRAEVLYELLLPAAGRNALDLVEIFTGAVARSLALLAEVVGRWADAEQHFVAALELNERFGARPWLAYTQFGYSRMLLARDAVGDRRQSLELLHEARRNFEQLGMDSWAANTAALLEDSVA